jgi:peptide/nickel transport system substrate-binding protein
VTLGVTALCACGDAEAPDEAPHDSFCQEVLDRTDAYLEAARSAGSVPGGERQGGTAVVAAINDIPGGMNALAANDYTAVQHQQFVNLMTLVTYGEDLTPMPYLAESWEVSADGTELTFHLRRDVRWHDGEATDAHDVAFTYLRATDPRTAFPNSGYWDFYAKGEGGVEVVDDYTVMVRMTPHAEFMEPWRTVAIMPEHLLADVRPEDLSEHPYGTRCPVGNGPFVFAEQRPQDRWVFEANPGFPEELGGRPYLDRLVYRVIPDETTLLVELLNGAIDVYIAPNPEQAGPIQDDADLQLLRFASRNYAFVGWNTRRPTLQDRRVRRALTLATDREEIVSGLLRNFGQIANSGVPPFHWAHSPDLIDTSYDPESAGRLLDEAGWLDADGDGIRENAGGEPLRVSIKYNQGNRLRQEVAEVMQAQLSQVGVEVLPQEVEWGTLLGQIFEPSSRDFDGVVLSWVSDFKLDESGLFHSQRSEDPTAFSGLSSSEVDRYLDTLQVVTDRDEARTLWWEYQKILDREHPYTYLFFPERLVGVSRRLRGVHMDARGEWSGVKEWWIPVEDRR